MVDWSIVNRTLLTGRSDSTGLLQFSGETERPLAKIALFDLDSTLIITKTGQLHAQDADDWKWWHENVPLKLRSLYNDGYRLIILTNQGRLTDAKGGEAPEAKPFKEKIEKVVVLLDVPITVYAACANDNYRKPRTGIWEQIKKDHQLSKDSKVSYLVGDAAGRVEDHSDSDVHFCINLGIDFMTPEEFFLDQEPEPLGDKFDPVWYLSSNHSASRQYIPAKAEDAVMLVLVGLPGAGKSTYYQKSLKPLGYEYVPLYEPGELADDMQVAAKLLGEGKPTVIDGINATIADRKIWISLAAKHMVQVRALHFKTPSDLCLHNDSVRALGNPELNHERYPIFPRIAFRNLEARFERPRKEEGFEEVLEIDFEWRGEEEELSVWKKHWL